MSNAHGLADQPWTDYTRDWHARKFPNSPPGIKSRMERAERIAAEPLPASPPNPTPEPHMDITPAPYVPIVWGRTEDPRQKPRVTVAEIVDACAAYAKVPVSHVISARRLRHLVRPRQAAMYLACEYGSLSMPEIGRRIGGRDHSTVIHGRNKVAADLAAGGEIFGDIVKHVVRKLGLG